MNLQKIYSLYNKGQIKNLFDIDFSILQGLQKQTFYSLEGKRIRKEYTFNKVLIVEVNYIDLVENDVLKGFQKIIKYYNDGFFYKEKQMSPKLYEMEIINGELTSIEGILYLQKCEQIKALKS